MLPRRLQGVCCQAVLHGQYLLQNLRFCNEAILGHMATRLARSDVLNRRRESVEPPFGTIKQWMNQGAFLMRGLANAWRVQPDGASLQYQRGDRYCRRAGHDCCCEGIIGDNLSCDCTHLAASVLLRSDANPNCDDWKSPRQNATDQAQARSGARQPCFRTV